MSIFVRRSRTPAEREAARARFIWQVGVLRWGIGVGLASALVCFALMHRPFRWADLWSVDFAVTLVIWVPLFSLWAGRRWAADFHDRMEARYGWAPPDD